MKIIIKANARINARDQLGRIAIDYASPFDGQVRAMLLAAGSLSPTGRSGRVVCDAQAALNALGLRSGHPDCWGSSTASVVKKFQEQRGLPASSELDKATIRALNIAR